MSSIATRGKEKNVKYYQESVIDGTRAFVSGVHIEYVTSANDVPTDIWDRFVRRDSVGLELAHLLAVEESGINDIHPYYLIGYEADRAIGIAYCFSIRINLADMTSDYPTEVIASVRTWKPHFMDTRVVEVGHIASLGRTVEAEDSKLGVFLHALARTIDDIAGREGADLCFFRDIEAAREGQFPVLESHGYRPAPGFPIARMRLGWNCFDGYLAALKAKKRNIVRKQRRKLEAPEIGVEVIDDYAPYAERLSELWTRVAEQNNGYAHERLTPEFFVSMCRHMGGRSHVVAIMLRGEIVAYGLNLIGDTEYFGVAEGIDYTYRDAYDLYANNIYEGVRVACELKKRTFNIGITTYDFKTSIGAFLDPCTYYVKSTIDPEYTGVYADVFTRLTKHTETAHRAFAVDCPSGGRMQQVPALQIRDDCEYPADPFARLFRYHRVDAARSADLYGYFPIFESAQESVIRHRGRDVIMLGTNSYLGLSTHPSVKQAMHEAIETYGSGCSGSPLLNGTLDIHAKLAGRLARFARKQDALVFSTGYQTNVGAISALVNHDDVIVMDRRDHASLVDGARLSGAMISRYRHNDLASLEETLEKHDGKPKLIVTDSYFSMEGSIVDLPEIVRLAKKHHARIMLDESHAIGVFGETGRGVAEHFGLTDDIDIIMGTFSKSLASIGGFIAGDRKLIDTIKHTARGHIFSASLPPSAVAAVLATIDIVENEPERRTRLMENAAYLADGLTRLGYEIGSRTGPIIPVSCGHELIALAAYQRLFADGVFVNPVTWPAVPKGSELLRVSVMATHDTDMLSRALDAFGKLRTSNWPKGVRHDR